MAVGWPDFSQATITDAATFDALKRAYAERCAAACAGTGHAVYHDAEYWGADATPDLDRLIQCSYTLLGLISFLTYGEDECRAWTIQNGTKAPQAAGKIHSDIERGFIRAETINFADMIACGSVQAAKEKGLLRSEGKDYVVRDGDMIYFRFNV